MAHISTLSQPGERGTDGEHDQSVGAYDPQRSEFARSTEVVYVNGIDTTFAQERLDAAQYANLVHDNVLMIHAETKGFASDLLSCAQEKLDLGRKPPENAVEAEVLAHLHGTRFDGDVHFAAHSRGALIVQRGLEQTASDLAEAHFTPDQVRAVLSHVSVETLGGASLGMPAGVRCVNYVDAHDSVANVFGQGKPTGRDIAAIDLAAGALALFPGGLLADAGVAAYLALKPAITNSNGPVVELPAVAPPPGSGPLGDLLVNHSIGNYLQHRRPFEQTYTAWQAQPQRHAAAAFDPVTVATGYVAEAATAAHLLGTG